ncbi:protein of unknown function (plasmid) [Rhodovastum atsumiense]|nr:hypothetical protein [Rhodovastum atsumiense]CAH2605751.1 protein of unknown function [Rhodovastum atsumiense]
MTLENSLMLVVHSRRMLTETVCEFDLRRTVAICPPSRQAAA